MRSILQTIFLSCLVAVIICHSGVAGETRIVGGDTITIDKAPYMVSLRGNDGRFVCGGTLISHRHVLTAAHCFDKRTYRDVFVVGGASTLYEAGVQQTIASIVKHPEYTPKGFHSDMAILTLAGDMRGKNIEPAPLCQHPLKEGDMVQISGWGMTYDDDYAPPSMELQTTRVPVSSAAKCYAEYEHRVVKNMFCASGREAKGACIGDSGGPAISGGEVCGVTAFLYKCGVIGHTAAYTDVYALRSFIKKATGF